MKKIVLAITALFAMSSRAAIEPPVDFGREVRPILAENCFRAMGRTSRRGSCGWICRRSRPSRPNRCETAIVPKQPDKSELVRRITSADEDEKMPPKDSRKSLTAGQIESLKKWIAQGAAYEGHWAFTAPVRPALPAVVDEKWVLNPIDRFVLARLDKEKLTPSAQADKVTLLRRLSLDLIGLPPTIEEVNAFLADASPTHMRSKWIACWPIRIMEKALGPALARCSALRRLGWV